MSERIIHPITGRSIIVDVVPVNHKEVMAWVKSKHREGHDIGAKQISWFLLSNAKQLAKMQAQEHGDMRSNNYGLRVFENALDWSLGLAFLKILASCPKGQRPKPYELLATRTGGMLARWSTGTIEELMAA